MSKVHKIVENSEEHGVFHACGLKYNDYDNITDSWDWKDVTCEKCRKIERGKIRSRLIFEKKPTCNEYIVKNKKGDILGQIAYYKVGRKKDWWFFVDWNPMDGNRDFWLGEDCLREIADFIAKLKSDVIVENSEVKEEKHGN